MKQNVDDRMIKCVEGDGGAIFKEAGNDVIQMSIKDVADYIVDTVIDCDYHDGFHFNLHNVPTEADFIKACTQYRKDRKDSRRVVKTWNVLMDDDGKTHGVIFTSLYKIGEYEFLDELMNDLDNNFKWYVKS